MQKKTAILLQNVWNLRLNSSTLIPIILQTQTVYLIHHLYKLQIYGKPTEKPTWFGYNIIFKITVYHDIVRNKTQIRSATSIARGVCLQLHTRHESTHSHQIWRAFKLLLKAHGILQQFNTRILPIFRSYCCKSIRYGWGCTNFGAILRKML